MNNGFDHCLFVGNFFEETSKEKFMRHTQLSLGNDNYEKGFISILKNVFNKVSCISFPPIPKFSRKFPFLYIRQHTFSEGNATYDFVPFFNSRLLNFRNQLLNKKIEKTIQLYNPHYVFLSTFHMIPQVDFLAKRFPHIKIVLLLPDLPMVEVSKLSHFARIYMRKINKLFINCINCVDLLLPITDKETSAIPFFKRKSMVYETYFDSSKFDSLRNISKKKNILYAGSLNKNYGILDLVDGFLSANIPDYKLLICGRGDALPDILERIKNCNNIFYLGQIKHDEVLRLEKECEMIVCPDSIKREYSFHSKYLEYFSSGTPVISFFPYGAKKEYIPFLYLIEENGGTIESALKKAVFVDFKKIKQKAALAEEYMRTKKNVDSFGQEIKTMLIELQNKNESDGNH